MLSISSSNNNYTKSQNSVNFKSNVLKNYALQEAINAAKVDLSHIGVSKRGQQFFRALEGLKNDGKKETIALRYEEIFMEPVIITVDNVVTSVGKTYNVPNKPGPQCQMALIKFAKERGINVNEPILAVEEKVDMLKKQLADTEQRMFKAIRTKLDNFIEK